MSIRARLHQGDCIFGGWIQITHPSAAEAMQSGGMDFIAIDAEHGDCDLSAIANTLRGLSRTPGFVRVRGNDTLAIRQALDCGAQGVIVPLVETADDARRAVNAAKYPPQGIRGFAFVRANGWGSAFTEYIARANDDTTVIVMAESARAIDNIDSILDVDGVDGALIGPYDLSGSLGVPGQTAHPLVLEAQRKLVAACQRHHAAAGFHLVTTADASIIRIINDGFNLIVLGMDTYFIANSMKQAVITAKQALKR